VAACGGTTQIFTTVFIRVTVAERVLRLRSGTAAVTALAAFAFAAPASAETIFAAPGNATKKTAKVTLKR
jgi:hypothetical protein